MPIGSKAIIFLSSRSPAVVCRYTRWSVKSSVEEIEENKVKLSVEVEESEIETAIEATFKKIAKDIRLPGFRPGKAPRKVIEARIGREYARAEAIQEALPGYYQKAVIEHDVDVIAAPEIDITDGQEDGPVLFDAVVEIRPTVNVGGYNGLKVEIPPLEPTEDEINGQIDQLRGQFAEQVAVERAAGEADFVTMDIATTSDGEPVAGLTADDYTYEMGSGFVVEDLDENLMGAEAGQSVTFDADHPDPNVDETLSFTVTVKEVKEKQLPELTDEFVAEASEFETVQQLTDEVTSSLTTQKQHDAMHAVQQKTGTALAQLIEGDIAEPLIQEQMESRLQDLAMRLGSQGIEFGQYMQITGQSQEDLMESMKEPAEEAARIDLGLRAVAVAEGLEVTDDVLQAEFDSTATQLGRTGEEVREMFENNGNLSAVKADILKRQAMEWLLENVEIVDENGASVDWEVLNAAHEAGHGDHADHDHAAHEDHNHDDHDHGEEE